MSQTRLCTGGPAPGRQLCTRARPLGHGRLCVHSPAAAPPSLRPSWVQAPMQQVAGVSPARTQPWQAPPRPRAPAPGEAFRARLPKAEPDSSREPGGCRGAGEQAGPGSTQGTLRVKGRRVPAAPGYRRGPAPRSGKQGRGQRKQRPSGTRPGRSQAGQTAALVRQLQKQLSSKYAPSETHGFQEVELGCSSKTTVFLAAFLFALVLVVPTVFSHGLKASFPAKAPVFSLSSAKMFSYCFHLSLGMFLSISGTPRSNRFFSCKARCPGEHLG